MPPQPEAGSGSRPAVEPEAHRAAALLAAERLRVARASTLEQLRSGRAELSTVLGEAQDDPLVGSIKIVKLVESVPGVGKVAARRALASLDLAPDLAAGDIDDTQCEALLAVLDAVTGGGVSGGRVTGGSGSPSPQPRGGEATRESASPSPQEPGGERPIVFIVCGAGGAGKSTITARMIEEDPTLYLSRSWTTRRRRPGEPEGAYVWVTEEQFQRRVAEGGFLEWAAFFEDFYGTPTPEVPAGCDLVLEIDVQGAVQVRRKDSSSVVIFVLPPSREEQERRMRIRGDDDEHVAKRLAKSDGEEQVGRELADLVIVNHDLEESLAQVQKLISEVRSQRPGGLIT
jgi:guanylate kinase